MKYEPFVKPHIDRTFNKGKVVLVWHSRWEDITVTSCRYYIPLLVRHPSPGRDGRPAGPAAGGGGGHQRGAPPRSRPRPPLADGDANKQDTVHTSGDSGATTFQLSTNPNI